MTALVALEAEHAWRNLSDALNQLADLEGREPVCAREPGLWFSDRAADRATAAEACLFCPLLHACGAYADAAGERWGVWAGVDRTTTKPKGKTA